MISFFLALLVLIFSFSLFVLIEVVYKPFLVQQRFLRLQDLKRQIKFENDVLESK